MGVRGYTNVRTLYDGRVQARECRAARNDPKTTFDLEMDRYLLKNGAIHELEWVTAE